MALSRLLEEHCSRLSTEVEQIVREARDRGRRELADQMNQAVRRLRQCQDHEDLAATLVDAASEFSSGAALFRMENGVAQGQRVKGIADEAADRFPSVAAPLASAAALGAAIESRDPVIAVTSEAELSAPLIAFFGHPADGRVELYPIAVREKVPALLYTWGAINGPVIELLTQVASAMWIGIEPTQKPRPELVHIAAPPPKTAWDSLSPGEQQAHFRAQRFARVQVAEMRLHHAEGVQFGRVNRNLYDALRPTIDSARQTFHQTFYSSCPSMVDYFHLELVHTLANDEPDLLGKDYPGPLA